MSRLVVVVVAYGAPGALATALTGVADRDVVVVDNSSRRDVRAVVVAAGARYLDAGGNLGFGGGVNVALAALAPDGPADVLLLNPDAEVRPEVVDSLHQALRAAGHEQVGMVAPALRTPAGATERVLWPFPSPRAAWAEALGVGRRRAVEREFLIGAVLMLRAEALADVGGFDERFFLYAEETDWQRRAWDAGWRPLLQHDLVAVHEGAGTSTDSVRRDALFHAGQETYIRKWFGARGWAVYRTAVMIGALVRSAVLRGDRRGASWRRFRLYQLGPRRVAGLEAR